MVLIMYDILQFLVAPLLSILHIYSVCEQMRSVPVNTLNPQRTAMIIADFVKVFSLSNEIEAYNVVTLPFLLTFLKL